MQNEVSHDRNRLEPGPEPGRVWSYDTSFCMFKRRFGTKMDPKLAEPFFGSSCVTPRFARLNAALSEFLV